jgi:DNA mismatch endonuclease (patch repair protein)
MVGNKSVNTVPEVLVRRLLHRRGLRFRKDFRIPLGTTGVRADVVFTRQRIAIFVDGCFWHGCPDHCRMPASNRGYWEAKIGRNVERDKWTDSQLRAAGWRVVRIWEHEDAEAAVDRITTDL